MDPVKKLRSFLNSHRASEGSKATHNGVCKWGGRYAVGEHDRVELCNLIAKCSLAGKPPSLVANTMSPDGFSEAKVDIDIKQLKTLPRQFGPGHEESLIDLFRESILKCSTVPSDNPMVVYFAKRKDVYDKANIRKDGIHLIAPEIRLDKDTNLAIRDHMVSRITERFLKSPDLTEIHVLNDPEDIVDKVISSGKNGFFTLGSVKQLANGTYIPPYDVLTHNIVTEGKNIATDIDISDESTLASMIYHVSHDSGNSENSFPGSVSAPKKVIKVKRATPTPNTEAETKVTDTVPDSSLVMVREAIRSLSERASDDRETWVNVCLHAKNVSETLRPDWVYFSEKSQKFDDEAAKKWDETGFNCPKTHSVVSIMRIRDKDRLLNELDDRRREATEIIRGEYGNKPTKIAEAIASLHGREHVCTNGRIDGWMKCVKGLWDDDLGGSSIRGEVSKMGNGGIMDLMIEYKDTLPDLIDGKVNKKKQAVERSIAGMLGCGLKDAVIRECSAIAMNDQSFREKLDSNNHLVSTKNGVIDMRDGVLRPVTPEDMISKRMCTGHDLVRHKIDTDNYTSDSEVVNEIFDYLRKVIPDDSVKRFLLKSVSSALNGGNKHNRILIHTGDGGNGKSGISNLVTSAMGRGLCEVNRSTIITGKRTESSGANSALAKLGKCRVLILNEVQGSRPIDSEMIKQLTGGDSVSVRDLYKSETSIKPIFLPILNCNELPTITDQTDGIWRRVLVIRFPNKFVDRPIDNDKDGPNVYRLDTKIADKINEWGPEFLSILLEFEKVAREEGLDVPPEIERWTSEYRNDSSVYKRFVNEMMVPKTGSRLRIIRAHTVYCAWYKEQSPDGKLPSRQTVKIKLGKALGKSYDANNGFYGWDIADGTTGWEEYGYPQ